MDRRPRETHSSRCSPLGRPAVDKIESLDQHGLFVRLLPEWAAVRNKPQRNAYHRFTVDRHLLEAAALAAELTDTVERPDLLLVGTLLHDIGKGYPGDHTTVGMEVVRDASRRGWVSRRTTSPSWSTSCATTSCCPTPPPGATSTIPRPSPVSPEPRGNRAHAAPARRTDRGRQQGHRPSAWGAWKAGLVADLVERTDQVLQGETRPAAPDLIVDANRSSSTRYAGPGCRRSRSSPRRSSWPRPTAPGLFSSVAGALALNGMDVRAANVSGEDGVAVEVFTVEVARGTWPDTAKLREDLAAVLSDRLAIGERLSERERVYPLRRRLGRPSARQRRRPSTTRPPRPPPCSRSGPPTKSACCTGSPAPSSTPASMSSPPGSPPWARWSLTPSTCGSPAGPRSPTPAGSQTSPDGH